MARFDVYAVPGDPGYLLDCQADLFAQLDSRFVIPLLPREHAPPSASRLNPVFLIGAEEVVMVTQSASAVPARLLRNSVTSLAAHQYVISNAIDMLLTGY